MLILSGIQLFDNLRYAYSTEETARIAGGIMTNINPEMEESLPEINTIKDKGQTIIVYVYSSDKTIPLESEGEFTLSENIIIEVNRNSGEVNTYQNY